MTPTPAEQLAAIRRVSSDIVPEEDLLARLEESARTGRPLRVKYGMDPTSSDIHVGNAIALHKLRTFQDFGHHAVIIIGDYTAMVGDPSGQDATRPMLTADRVEEHARTYLDQVGLIVDLEEAEIRRNGEWFRPMTFAETMRLLSKMTVARMLERDSFEARYRAGKPIGIHEFIYCLMQGFDSVAVESDVELGGADQTFNLMIGRELQRDAGQRPQVCITHPLLEGTDGQAKMSKSLGNAIGITDDPREMFGKAMSLSDELMPKYFAYATDLSEEEVRAVLGGHPRDAKDALSRAIVTRYHGPEAAERASSEFRRVFAGKELPDEMPEVTVKPAELQDGAFWIVKLLVRAGFAKSNGEARRLVTGGGVSLDEVTVAEPGDVAIEDGQVLRAGKRRFARIRIRDGG
jgi:tyrosyl-tRNA synthetase